MVLAGTTTASAQKGNSKLNLSLVGFNMPNTAMIDETITIGGYIKNDGTKSVSVQLLMNYLISLNPDVPIAEVLPSFAYAHYGSVLLPGESIYYQREIIITDEYFIEGQDNIVTIWPTAVKTDKEDEIDSFTGSIYILGNNNKMNKKQDLDKVDIKSSNITVYPNPTEGFIFIENRERNKDVHYVICYDAFGKAIFEQQLDIVSKTTKGLSIPFEKTGIFELAFYDKAGNLLQTQRIASVQK